MKTMYCVLLGMGFICAEELFIISTPISDYDQSLNQFLSFTYQKLTPHSNEQAGHQMNLVNSDCNLILDLMI